MKLAIAAFNLGGPDKPEAVRPFLRNLFRDPAIIQAPGPIREMLAWLISTTRAKSARENYAKMGGGSPLVPETQKQLDALEAELRSRHADLEVKIWPAMRYWHPFTEDTAREIEAWQPDRVILLPLYPQFSTTTTASSLDAWTSATRLQAETICCYPTEEAFIDAHVALLRDTLSNVDDLSNTRVLFSAHGLPKKIVDQGDPYQWQVEQTVAAVVEKMPEITDHEICYQSRVGPLEWIGPSTDDAIERAGKACKNIVLTPIAFVSEHIETLVELDEEYAELASEHGVPMYLRVPALGTQPEFIKSLADMVDTRLNQSFGLAPDTLSRICPRGFGKCRCAISGSLEA